MNDEAAMMAVKDGDLDQLSQLFDKYHALLFSFFLRLTSDRDTSQDLTQTTFLRVMKYRSSFKEGSVFRPWLYQIARNVHSTYSKQNPKGRFKEDDLVRIADQENFSYNSLEHQEIHQHLQRALVQLPDEYREIILLSKYQGLKYEDIAAITHLSVGAVKVRVHRALKALREIYFQLEKKGL